MVHAGSSFQWDKLSPAEFQQLQELTSCEYTLYSVADLALLTQQQLPVEQAVARRVPAVPAVAGVDLM